MLFVNHLQRALEKHELPWVKSTGIWNSMSFHCSSSDLECKSVSSAGWSPRSVK